MTRQKKWVIAGILIAILTLATSVLILDRDKTVSPLSTEVKTSVAYPLYIPTHLPKGWTVTKNSATASQGMVLYTVTTPRGNIVVTQQPKPPASFDFNSFYSQGLAGASPFSTLYGTAAIGKANGHYTGSLVTDDSWILLATDSTTIEQTDMHQLFDSLKPAK